MEENVKGVHEINELHEMLTFKVTTLLIRQHHIVIKLSNLLFNKTEKQA
ncbi:hypothetical protein [Bacillus thuringiensis]|nr:hypothetical protein [Bacillus thuringiensis]